MNFKNYLNQEEPQKLKMGEVNVSDKECTVHLQRSNAMKQNYYIVHIKHYPEYDYMVSASLCENGIMYTMDDDGNPKRPSVFRYAGDKIIYIKK